MREVEIDGSSFLNVYCPRVFAKELQDDRFYKCHTTCAWFSRRDTELYEFTQTDDGKFLFCQDHCIGQIKEPDNG